MMAPHPPPIDDYFFFSYARKDEYNEAEEHEEHLFEFFKHLCAGIRGEKPESLILTETDSVGFIDQEQPLGANYVQTLPAALQKCKALICLYSPSYFTRKICGQEVQVFLDRRAKHGGDPEVILPVIWKMTDRIPTTLQSIQHMHRDFPTTYRERGLRELMIQKANAREYRLFLAEMTNWVLEANKHQLKPLPTPVNLDTQTAAFPEILSPGTPAPTSQPPPQGPKTVRFVYIAGTNPGWAWVPFPPPPPPEAIGRFVAGVALSRGFFPDKLDLPADLIASALASPAPTFRAEDFIAELDRAKRSNTPVVLLVNPQTLEVSPYSQLLDAYDGCNFLNCAALVIWDASTPLSAPKEKKLRGLLEAIFDDNYARSPQFFRDNIRTPLELTEHLSRVLDDLYRNVLSKGAPSRSVPGQGSPIPAI